MESGQVIGFGEAGREGMKRRMRVCLAIAILGLSIPTGTLAQSITPPRGELFLSVNYQYLDGGDHLFASRFFQGIDLGSTKVDAGKTQSQVVVFEAQLGITDRLAIEGAIAVIGSKYTPSGLGTAYGGDSEQWDPTFQDARIGARYTVFRNANWAITPSVSWGFPTTDYYVLGHSAPGRGLQELRLGVDVGRVLRFGNGPAAFVQGSYSYAFMEYPDVHDILIGDHQVEPLDRSNILFEFGFFLPKSITLQAFTDYQNMAGGIGLEAFDHFPADHSHDEHEGFEEFFAVHDLLLAEDSVRVGGGLSIPVSNRLEIYGNVATTVWGRNTHQALTLSFGMSWSFQLFGGFDFGR